MGYWDDVTPQSVANAEDGFKEFRIGENEAYVKSVEEMFNRSGDPMIVITFENNEGAEIKYYIVEGEYKLSKLKQFYIAFGIPLGSRDIEEWRGKRGIVVCKQGEPYNGKIYNKVSYLKPIVGQAHSRPPITPPPQQPDLPQGTSLNPPSDEFYDDIPF